LPTLPTLHTVGTSVTRIDAWEKVTGAARYAPDLRIPGMLHAKMLRSPHPHARVVHIDATRAERLRGVRAVLPASSVPRVVGTWFNLRSEKELAKLFNQDAKVRFVGDPVLAVAAADEETALEALDLIDVEYDVLKPVFDPFDALVEPDVAIHDRGNVAFHILKEYGDLEKGFSEAQIVVANRFTTQKTKHAALEPFGTCIADYSLDGRLTMWDSSQVPHWTQMYLSLALGIPISRVRVIRPHVGGGFGGRAGLIWGLELTTAFLSRAAGAPVRMCFTREEDFTATESRHPFVIDMKTGATRAGLIVANHAKVLMDVGGYGTQYKSVLADALGTGVGLYRIPNYTFEGTIVYTNKSLCGAMRGYGNPQMNFAQESQLDIIANMIGLDPIQLRLRNYRGKGEIDPVFNTEIQSDGMKECLSRGAAAIGWVGKGRTAGTSREVGTANADMRAAVPEAAGTSTAKAAAAEDRTPYLKRGVGMACHQHGTGARFGLPDPASAIVRVNADGSIDLLTACADDGQGNRTVLAQFAAEVLGVDVETITVSPADTGIAPLDAGTHGSRQTYCGGTAVMQAAAKARDSIMAYAAEQLDVDEQSLRMDRGMISAIHDPERRVSLPDLMRRMQLGDFSLCHQIVGEASGVTEGQPPVFGATFAEVEVDVETGQIRVLRMVGAFDLGRAINPDGCRGQIQGGLVMGAGFALTEGLIIQDGRVLNPGFTDYKIPRFEDAPEVIAVLVESNEPTGPFGAKGLGEATVISAASAIANAVQNAAGVRMKTLCITAESVLEALRAAPQD
jgi:xanthine dehydrogenase molybdenum-binding subunit